MPWRVEVVNLAILPTDANTTQRLVERMLNEGWDYVDSYSANDSPSVGQFVFRKLKSEPEPEYPPGYRAITVHDEPS